MSENLETRVQYLGFGDSESEESDEYCSVNSPFRNLIQKFRNKETGEIYEAVFTEHGLQCNCQEWNSRKCCKHVVYVFDRLSMRDENGRIINIASKVAANSQNKESLFRDFRNSPEKEKWLAEHLEVIEL